MSVTFTVFTQPLGWAISCSCGSVNYVTSYVSYRDAYDALGVGVAPACGDELCGSYNCSVIGIEAETVPEVNMANGNARHVLDLLGLDTEDACGSVTGEDMLGRVLMAQAVAPTDEGTPTYTDGIMTNIGRWAGYSESRLAEIESVARFAIERELEVQWS